MSVANNNIKASGDDSKKASAFYCHECQSEVTSSDATKCDQCGGNFIELMGASRSPAKKKKKNNNNFLLVFRFVAQTTPTTTRATLFATMTTMMAAKATTTKSTMTTTMRMTTTTTTTTTTTKKRKRCCCNLGEDERAAWRCATSNDK